MPKISWFFLGVLIGAVAGVFATGAYLGGEIADRDRELGENNRLVGELRADRERIKDQAGILGGSIEAIGVGIGEAKGLADKAGHQSGSITAALKELARNFQSLQILVADLELRFIELKRKYDALLSTLGNKIAP